MYHSKWPFYSLAEMRERVFLTLQMRLGSYVFTNQPFIKILFNRAVHTTASVEINSPGHEKQPIDLLRMGLFLCLERPTSPCGVFGFGCFGVFFVGCFCCYWFCLLGGGGVCLNFFSLPLAIREVLSAGTSLLAEHAATGFVFSAWAERQ